MASEPFRAEGWDPRFKVAMLLLVGIMGLTLDSIVSLAALAGLGLASVLAARPSPRQLLLLVLVLALAVWGMMLSQALFYREAKQTVLFVLIPAGTPLMGSLTGGVTVSREGLLHGGIQSLRIVAAMSAGLAVAWTTEPNRLLAGFSSLRLPDALAFSTATAIRFLPVTIEEARTALRAQRMRGLRLEGRAGLNTFRALLLIARPVLAASIRRAEMVALAAASRAYDPDRKRTSLHPLSMSFPEKALLTGAVLLTGFAVSAKVLYLLYESGIFYRPGLQALYTLTREIL